MAGERTEKATPMKRRKERKKGNIPLSKDVVTAVSIMGSFLILKMLFPLIYKTVREYMIKGLSEAGTRTDFSLGAMKSFALQFAIQVIKGAFPLLLVCMVMGILSTGIQTKFLFSSKKLQPKFDKLNPIKGLKNMVSPKNLVELLKSSLKVIILIYILYSVFIGSISDMMRLMDMGILASASYMLNRTLKMVIQVGAVFLVIAAADFAYQRWSFEKGIRMSKEEIKEEFKQTEGNPQIKSRIRNIQMKRAQERMMQAVPDADVIIRNPTHFAVALKYNIDKDTAPIVVAKGQDSLALRIVAVGEAHGVAIVENKPLARAIYAQSELSQPIPVEVYGAVAEILVYVYKMNKKKME